MPSSNCCFLTCIQISQEAWSGGLIFPSLEEFSSLWWSTQSKALTAVDVFLELSCFFYDPTDVGNVISGSSVFSESNLNIWKFTVPVLVKPGLENVEHYLASMWDECNCVVVWAFLGITLLWDWNETDLFQYCGHCWVFQICWHTECSTLTASYLRFEIAQLAFHHIHQLCS